MRLDAMTMATTIIKKFSILATATMFLLGFNILIMISPFAMAATTHSDHSLDCSTPCPQSVVLKEEEDLPEIEKDVAPEPTPKATSSDSYSLLPLKSKSVDSFHYNAENKVPMYIRIGLMRL
ncbi:hypothetical protein KDA06_00995 [Candidatus Saccharibacteria bacterium]|jgi:hypothetical protein|nr:hypothetical protein [Candidatus Saccharibacteria bacterium]HPR09674.1 hypothetical protein [Candidatus Saccharibacteria bacterium]